MKSTSTTHSNQIRHPLPPRPILTTHHQPNKENQSIIKSMKSVSYHSMNSKDDHQLPIKPTFNSKPINQLIQQTNRNQESQSIQTDSQTELNLNHTRKGSIRSSSSTSTLLSPTTREESINRRNFQIIDNQTIQQERVLAIVKVKQAVIEAKARKNIHPITNVYTPKPLLLPYKLARSSSLNLKNSKKISFRSNLLNHQIHSTSNSNSNGERYTHRRQLNSESIIFNHRRMFTESTTVTSPPSQSIHSPRSDGCRNRYLGLSPDHRRSQYDSFYQLIGPESESDFPGFTADDRFRNHSVDRRRDSSNSVLLSPVTIDSSSSSSSRSWNPNHIQPLKPQHPNHTPLGIIIPETTIGNQKHSIKKLRNCKSDGSICLKPLNLSLISLNKISIHSHNNQTYSEFQNQIQIQNDRGKGKEGKLKKDCEKTAIGKLKSILEENEDEVEFDLEKEIVDRLKKFKKFVWN